MPVTSHDVARYAGVSQATVSRALRGVPGISAATVERVRLAAEALSYVPSEAGRSLSTRQTRCIGVVTAELTNPFYPELVEPIRNLLAELGYRTLLIPESLDSASEAHRLPDGILDAVIVTTATYTSKLPDELSARKIPYVLVNRTMERSDADTCVIDNGRGAKLVAELLVDLGHRDIGAILGPKETSTGRERERGFRDGLNEHGIPLRATRTRRGIFAYETGHAAALDLFDQQPAGPSAIFCGNDVIALGACNAAAARGIRVGQDVTIIGFDDIHMASWDLYKLTTVRCDLSAMAEHAVRLVTERIEKPERAFEQVVLEPHMILRQSHHRLGR